MKMQLVAALLAVGFAMPAAAQSIGGAYTVAGTNADDSEYTGKATITIVSETTCEIVWETSATNATGICSRNDDAFAAAYVQGDMVGLVIYKVQADGSLHGLWTVQGEDGVGTEVLTPQQ